MKKKNNFLESFFVIVAGLAMPFIVVGSYFNLTLADERDEPLAIFFSFISIVYALLYAYFS